MLASDFFFLFIFSFFFGAFWIFLVSMVSNSEVRIACPSILFLFVHLGASLDVSHSFSPLIEGFVFKGNSLNVVLVELLSLLRQ